MADGIRFDLSPRTEFADRLEADLLRTIGDPASHTSTPTTTRTTPRRDLDEEHIMTITLDQPTDHPTPHHRRRWLMVAAAAAAVLLVVAGVWAIGRGDDNGPSGTRDVSFTVRWAVSNTVQDCPTDVTAPVCAFRYDIPATATFTGDIAGAAYQSVVWGDSDDFADRAVRHEDKAASYVVGGSVAGCGTGQFLMVETVQTVSGPDRDFSQGTLVGTWQIISDSGRDGLRSISGSGTSSGLVSDYETLGRSFSGTVNCEPSKDLSANEIVAPLGPYVVPTDRQEITAGGGDLPNGTYRAEFTAQDLDRLEPDIEHVFTDGGAIELTLEDGQYTAQGFLPSGAEDGDAFSSVYQVLGNQLIWTLPQNMQVTNSDGINVFEWSIDGDTLTFTQVDGKHRDPWFAVPYTRVP